MSNLLPFGGGNFVPASPAAAEACGPPGAASDWAERRRALDPERSFLVQAPAGSGKTYLLTQRFLRLLGRAEKPDEIVAITFTNAAAAEMRNRILEELEKAERTGPLAEGTDPESLEALAWMALERARLGGWKLLDQPGQLRITTIDAFCRGLALQSPLSWGALKELGGRLDPVANPDELYRRAAARTLDLLRNPAHPARESVEALLLWRDNYWKEVEDLLVKMLADRNRWFQEFVFSHATASDEEWGRLRERLEGPFRRALVEKLERLGTKLEGLEGCREFALELARFSNANGGSIAPQRFVERDGLPVFAGGLYSMEELADGLEAYGDLARFLLTNGGTWRARLDKNMGFPSDDRGKTEKRKFAEFVGSLEEEPGLEAALAAFQKLMPLKYAEDEWTLIRHCFAVMRVAAGQLQVVFAETGSVDFTEVARIALDALGPVDGFPSEFALRVADGIRHLLVDEFQDTSRKQHQLLARLVGAWPEREGRSCFCVGDPMQSIYGFREAEVELFERLKTHGLEMGGLEGEEPFLFDFVALTANFRTVPTLVADLNGHFGEIFAEDDGSGVRFTAATAARESRSTAKTELHLAFTRTGKAVEGSQDPADAAVTRTEQLAEMVAFIRERLAAAETAGLQRFRIAVLGRAKSTLMPVAQALREAGISFRAIDLVPLRERPEVVDALALARALLNPVDRMAWLGVLRAPWCGLSLKELHWLTSADDGTVMATAVPELLRTRLAELLARGEMDGRAYAAAERVGRVMQSAGERRGEAAESTLGSWVESVWKALGGEATADAEQRENLRLLWRCLDGLPEGEVNLLGPGLEAALEKLFALPNPAASAEFGVQLMTIHGSKGLEFEVVIVPDLEARGGKGDQELLVWLERGLVGDGEDSEALTEFLIGPIQTKGADAGAAKAWVGGVKKTRETSELRRLLYVAATRAREELHLFARPRFSEKKGELVLGTASGLLATAWPALEAEVQARFEEWVAEIGSTDVAVVAELAAASGSNVVAMPGGRVSRPTLVRRLPEGFEAGGFGGRAGAVTGLSKERAADLVRAEEPLYARTEGGLHSRLVGTAIHLLLERLSGLRLTMDAEDAGRALDQALPGIVGAVRGKGLTVRVAEQLAGEALVAVQRMAADPVGDWILAAHAEAETEARWTGLVGGAGESGGQRMANLRPDRVFFAEALKQLEYGPLAAGPVWWIVDYKTSHTGGRDLSDEAVRREFLSGHREQHRGQLSAYAQVLRALRGGPELQIRAGIYYPRLRLFDCWEA